MTPGTRFVGIDYGTRRIGLAISDPSGCIASPLATLESAANPAQQVRQVIQAVADEGVGEWVVGLPLNMDGSDSHQTRITRRFAALLERRFGGAVHLWDERLSTRQADEYLEAAKWSEKKRKTRRDRVAAQIILQTFLDARGSKP